MTLTSKKLPTDSAAVKEKGRARRDEKRREEKRGEERRGEERRGEERRGEERRGEERELINSTFCVATVKFFLPFSGLIIKHPLTCR